VDGNSRDIMVGTLQSRNRLENKRGENDEMSGRMQKAVEASSKEVGMGKTEGGESKERSGKEKREKEKEKER